MGKRTPSGGLKPGLRIAVNPQAFAWEQLREPVRVDSISELAQRFAELPPTPLRPRLAGENFHVLAIGEVIEARFDAVRQGGAGRAVYLVHPFVTRGALGVEALLAAPCGQQGNVIFAAVRVRLTPWGMQLFPVSVMLEDGEHRDLEQPWVEKIRGPVGKNVKQPEPKGTAKNRRRWAPRSPSVAKNFPRPACRAFLPSWAAAQRTESAGNLPGCSIVHLDIATTPGFIDPSLRINRAIFCSVDKLDSLKPKE